VTDALRDLVRDRYAEAALKVLEGSRATCCGPAAGGSGDVASAGSCCGDHAAGSSAVAAASCCGDGAAAGPLFGSELYDVLDRESLPSAARLASLGCGNPTAVAELREGETVLDLGSGGGIDVLLSATRVGRSGTVYGLDMTDEMVALANRNKAEAGATNVEFLKGAIEDVPLPARTIDVIISNCVINLSTDKPAVFREMARVLRPGGRIGISDIVARDDLSAAQRAERGSYVGCIAGALSFAEYRAGLAAAGFEQISLTATHAVADGMHSAIIKAVRSDGWVRKEVTA
jgi:arsenite methyltransferase